MLNRASNIGSGLRCELATDFGQLEALENEWNSIWHSDSRQEIFTRFEWARSIWRVYGPQRRLCTPLVYRDGHLVGILPLSIENGVLGFLGSPRSDYNDILCDVGADSTVLEIALTTLLEEQNRAVSWKWAMLANVAEQSRLAALLIGLPTALRARLKLVFGIECFSIALSSEKTNEILKSVRTGRTLRRKENYFRRTGDLSLRHLDDREEIKTHLPEFFRQHELRWVLTGKRSQFSDENGRLFYKYLIEEYDPSKELRFSVLEHGGRPIAYHLGFLSRGKFLWYKPTFDIDLWKYSPGEILQKHLFEHIANLDVGEFDYTIGDETYKKRYSNQRKWNYTLLIFPRTPAGTAGMYLRGIQEQLKQRPRIFRFTKAAQDGIVSGYRDLLDGMRRDGFPGYGQRVLCRLWRLCVYRADHLVVSLLGDRKPSDSEHEIKLSRGTLADLASLALQYPNHFSPENLLRMRKRLLQGDDVYISMWEKGAPAIVLWVGKHDEISSRDCSMSLDQESVIISDCWIEPSFRKSDVYADALRSVLPLVYEEELQIWALCDGDNKAFQRAIEQAGFNKSKVIVSGRLAHWFAWSRIATVDTP